MQLFPVEHFTIASANTFEQNVKRLSANFKDGFFSKVIPVSGSTYNADDTFYFRMATKGRGGLNPVIKCIIKQNDDAQTCDVFCQAKLHPVYWGFIVFLMIVAVTSIALVNHYIAMVCLLIAIYAFFIFTFQLDVKRLKEKLEAVFSGNVS